MQLLPLEEEEHGLAITGVHAILCKGSITLMGEVRMRVMQNYRCHLAICIVHITLSTNLGSLSRIM